MRPDLFVRRRFNAAAATLIAAALAFLVGAGAIANAAYMPAKAALAQLLLERAWAREQGGADDARPWPWADAEVLGEIRVDRLGAHAIMLSEASGEALAFAPGHLSQTPAPGAPGLSVISAHRDTHFGFLKDIRVGDRITATTREGTFDFRVFETRIVRWDASGLDAQGPGRRIALTTCYPFGAVARGPLRYVVLAEMADGKTL